MLFFGLVVSTTLVLTQPAEALGKRLDAYHRFTPLLNNTSESLSVSRQLVSGPLRLSRGKLTPDGSLFLAATALLSEFRPGTRASIPASHVREAVLAAGATEPALALFVAQNTNLEGLAQSLHNAMKRTPPLFTPTHLGLAIRDHQALLLLSRRRLELSPIIKRLGVGAPLTIAGRAPQLRNQSLQLSIRDSRGRFTRQNIHVQSSTFKFAISLEEQAESLNIELLGDFGEGLEVASHFPVLGPKESPLRGPPHFLACVANTTGSRAQDEGVRLERAINCLRRGARVAPLKSDHALGKIAKEHAIAMLRFKHFAHRDLDGCDASGRLRRAHYNFCWVFENLAISDSIENALFQWSESPAHLQNFLDDRAERLGVGIVRGLLPNTLFIAVLLSAQPSGLSLRKELNPVSSLYAATFFAP